MSDYSSFFKPKKCRVLSCSTPHFENLRDWLLQAKKISRRNWIIFPFKKNDWCVDEDVISVLLSKEGIETILQVQKSDPPSRIPSLRILGIVNFCLCEDYTYSPSIIKTFLPLNSAFGFRIVSDKFPEGGDFYIAGKEIISSLLMKIPHILNKTLVSFAHDEIEELEDLIYPCLSDIKGICVKGEFDEVEKVEVRLREWLF